MLNKRTFSVFFLGLCVSIFGMEPDKQTNDRTLNQALLDIVAQGFVPYKRTLSPDEKINIVRRLLNNGANINAQNSSQESVLHLAIENELILWLLKQPNINLEQKDKLGFTPLGKAAWKSNSSHFHLLLCAGANWKNANKSGITPIHTALSLSRAGDFFDSNGNNLLHMAVNTGDRELIKHIIAHQPELVTMKNKQRQTPIELAVEHGNQFKALKIFLKAGEKHQEE